MKEAAKPFLLDNGACIYCGRTFGEDVPRTKEHVIGRKFVPKGSFKANDWNLIVWACRPCNNRKSKLEGEISAITLQLGIGTTHIDSALRSLAERKASKTRSEATGRTVRESGETFNLTHSFASNSSMTFGFVAPPRLVPDRVKSLAAAQVSAFFYLITFDKSQRTGSYLPGGITWLAFAQRVDWGNAQFLAFASLTKDWKGRVRGDTAENYFRIAIKRASSEIELWSFALEWNQNYRVIGFFGDATSTVERVAAFPSSDWMRLDETTRIRQEIPLKSSGDFLFQCRFDD